MRKLIIYTLSILFAFQSAMAADFTVTGKMKGLTNGSTATLKNVFNGQVLASGNITDGAFVLKWGTDHRPAPWCRCRDDHASRPGLSCTRSTRT